MKKLRINKKLKPFLPFFLLFLVIIYLLLPSIQHAVYGGITAISIDNVEVLSDNPYFDEPVYHIVAIINPSSRTLEGEATHENLPVALEVSGSSNTKCLYKISNQSKKIWYWDVADGYGTGGWDDCCSAQGCSCDCGPRGCSLKCYVSRLSTKSVSTYTLSSHGCKIRHVGPSNKLAGEVYYIDPVAIYDYDINITFKLGDLEIPVHLDSDTTSAYVKDFAYIQFLGSLIAQQECPALYTDAVIWRNPNSANMTLIWKYAGQDAMATQTLPNQPGRSFAEQQNTRINTAINSTYEPFGYQCSLYGIDPTEAKILCDPVGTVAYPMIEMYIKADKIQQLIPEGQPEIINVKCEKVEAVDKTDCEITVKNTGKQKDTFEVSMKGFKDISPFSVKVEVPPDEEKTALIPYSGSGIIGNFTIKACSVNNPELCDTKIQKIVIEPFCDTPKPLYGNPIKIMTEKGCIWYQDNYYEEEIGEYSGVDMQKYLDRIGTPNCADEYGTLKNCTAGDITDTLRDNFLEKYHCTGLNERAGISWYVHSRNDGEIDAFIPQDRRNEHLYFVPAYYNKYYCSYLAEYGYTYDPQTDTVKEITEDMTFNYGDTPKEETGEAEGIIGGITGQPPEEQPPTAEGEGISTELILWVVGMIGIAGLFIFGYKFFKKR